ncbi:MerR family transcriptional regulator [Plantactinospora sp. WMMB334]|uniref:MerR family transcriptional regulator n=1 Tax=Plantactinospora sp. WMMB334 TaxID=3404119 RepID=UPI003B9306C4
MRIGDLATTTGVSARALRYYEEHGLLWSTRTPGGQRSYSEAAVERVQIIQQLYAAGIPSRTIANLLPCIETRTSTPESRTLLIGERDRINTQMTKLATARQRLDELIAYSTSAESGCAVVPGEPESDALTLSRLSVQ